MRFSQSCMLAAGRKTKGFMKPLQPLGRGCTNQTHIYFILVCIVFFFWHFCDEAARWGEAGGIDPQLEFNLARISVPVQKCESILILILFSIWSSDRFRMFWLVLISVLLINISTAPNFAVMSCAAYLTLSLEDVSHTTP